MEELESILKNYLDKGSDRIDVTAVLSLIKIIKEEHKKQLTLTDVVKSFYCLGDPKFGGVERCNKQCKGCEMKDKKQ